MYFLSTLQIVLISLTFISSESVPKTLRKYKICNRLRCKSIRSLSEDDFEMDSFSYSRWTNWYPCSRRCSTKRYRSCRFPLICGTTTIHEEAFCYHRGTICERIYTNSQTNSFSNYAESDYSEYGDYRPNLNTPIRRVDYESMDANNNPFSRNSYVKRFPEVSYPSFRLNNTVKRRFQSERTNPLLHKPRLEIERSYSEHFLNHDDSLEQRNQFLSCGIARTNNSRGGINLRILGGKESMKGRWPWQVAIINTQHETFCGGTLIAPRWILTAAHCVRRRIEIIIGEHHLNKIDGTEKHYQIESAFIHPGFDIETVDNDIALLLLPEAVPTDAGKACLPHEYDMLPSPNTLCTILGWGKERYNNVFGTTVLHEGKVPIVSNAECRFTYNRYEITPNMFCAGYQRGTVDSCAGDSGGPLLCSVNQRWTVFGVTSFGDGCGRRGKFGIYAKVTNYVSWIKKIMNANEQL